MKEKKGECMQDFSYILRINWHGYDFPLPESQAVLNVDRRTSSFLPSPLSPPLLFFSCSSFSTSSFSFSSSFHSFSALHLTPPPPGQETEISVMFHGASKLDDDLNQVFLTLQVVALVTVFILFQVLPSFNCLPPFSLVLYVCDRADTPTDFSFHLRLSTPLTLLSS